MGFIEEVILLDFKWFADGHLTGEVTRITPTQQTVGQDLLWVSFDATEATHDYTGYLGGLIHILKQPEPRVDKPLSLRRAPERGHRFAYSHEARKDGVLVAVAFPAGWSANYFDPWPAEAKQFGDTRLAVKYDLYKPKKFTLSWLLEPLSDAATCLREVQRINNRETGADSEKTLVLFIHGLGGDEEGTWGRFPEILRHDEEFDPRYQVAFVGYPTSLFRGPFGPPAPRIQELAAGLRTHIENRYADFSSIVLVCHSLGGLIARQYLLDEVKAGRPLRVSGIVLFAVPNNGADLAAVGNRVSLRHWQLKQLCRDSDLINILNTDWFTMGLDKDVRAIYVWGTQDQVVDRPSALGRWGNPDVAIVLGKGHRDLVKPEQPDEEAVLIVKRFLKDAPVRKDSQNRV